MDRDELVFPPKQFLFYFLTSSSIKKDCIGLWTLSKIVFSSRWILERPQQIGVAFNFCHDAQVRDAATIALILNTPISNFKVQRGVCQGCPLAPYLFIMVGEAMN